MPRHGTIECHISSGSNDALTLRFHDSAERKLPLSTALRSKTIEDMIEGTDSAGSFTFSDPHGHLAWWLQFLDDVAASYESDRKLGSLAPLKLIYYLRV